MKMDYCSWNETSPYRVSWISESIITPIIIILEIIWFINQIWFNRNDLKKIPKALYVLYVAIQCITIIWTVYGLIINTLLPVLYPDFIFNTFLCIIYSGT